MGNRRSSAGVVKSDRSDESERATRRSETPQVLEKPTKSHKRRVPPSIEVIDPLVVQAKRRNSISVAQDEEEKWAKLKKCFRGEFDKLTYGQIGNVDRIADRFVLSKDGILYYLGRRRGSRESFDDYLENCD